MADVAAAARACTTTRRVAGDLQDLVAPPYDVIDPPQRDGARGPLTATTSCASTCPDGDDPTPRPRPASTPGGPTASSTSDDEPALWALTQDYTGPRRRRARRGAASSRGSRVEDYGPGRIRPHERTHPGPKEDRLRLTRATRANLSPIFALYSDPRAPRLGRPRARTSGPRRGPRRSTTTAPSTGSGASPTPRRSTPCGRRRATPSC